MNSISILTVKQPNPELHPNSPPSFRRDCAILPHVLTIYVRKWQDSSVATIYPYATNTLTQLGIADRSSSRLDVLRAVLHRGVCLFAVVVVVVAVVVVRASLQRMANSEHRCGCWQTSSGGDRGRRSSAATPFGNTYIYHQHHHQNQPVDVIVKSSSPLLRCTDSPLRDDDGSGMLCGSGSTAIDLNDRFHRLSNNVRHDFGTVYTMIKVIDDKLHALEEYFVRARHQERWSAISETVAQTDSIRLDQIAAKCDQILKRLDVVESKLDSSPVVEVTNQATVSLDDISVQLNQLSKDVHGLFNAQETQSSKVKHVTLVREFPPAPSKPVHAKMFTLNPKHRISSFLAPRTKSDNETLIPKVNKKSAQPKQTPADTPEPTADDSLAEETLTHCAARLRDPKVMTTVRIFLAFLADQPASVSYDGMTCTSVRMFLALEGFPVAADKLKELYLRIHERNGIGKKEVLEDLATYRAFIASERIQRMQRARESTDKFYGRNVSKSK